MHTASFHELLVRSSLCSVLLICTNVALAAKTDLVYLDNGDRVTAEIKNLDRGRLKLSTDTADTIYVEWSHIVRVTSAALYVVELKDGSRMQGSLADTDSQGKILLQQATGSMLIDMQDVIWIDPLKISSSYIKRWDGSVSAGFDAAKANNRTSLTASFDAHRRAESFLVDISSSLYTTRQTDVEDTVRASFAGAYRRLLKDRWYWGLMGSEERNDEIGIDLRSLAGAGYGRFLIQSGNKLWSVMGGLAVTNEQRAGESGSENNAEALLSMDYEYFTYDSPKTSFNFALTAYPSLTEKDRIRGNLDLSFRRELIKDLFVDLSLYYTYDSLPPDSGEKDDYGLTTSLGYTF